MTRLYVFRQTYTCLKRLRDKAIHLSSDSHLRDKAGIRLSSDTHLSGEATRLSSNSHLRDKALCLSDSRLCDKAIGRSADTHLRDEAGHVDYATAARVQPGVAVERVKGTARHPD